MNVSWRVWYKEQVGGQKKEKNKPIEVGVKEWEVEKILNKRKIRGVDSVMEEVYSRKWHMRKEGRFGKYKGGIGRIWRKNEYRGEEAREARYSRRKEF